MADAVVGPLIENLNSLVQRELGLICGIKKDVRRLSSLLSTIQAVLQDAEMREFSEKSIVNWLTKLKDKTYDADDVLDEWLSYAPDGTCALSCINPEYIKLRNSTAKKIKKIITRLDEIAGERLKFHLNPTLVETGLQSYETRETASTLAEDVVYGRDADKEKIVTMLLSNVSHVEKVSVFSILGIGGIGKTTLAQFVNKDERLVKHFDVKIWVCVSEDFDVKRLIRMMLESLTIRACDLRDLDPLERQLRENLTGKRFLLILDDVWNEDPEKWHRLKSILSCGAKGSSILVTTRLETVASIVRSPSPHRLTFLSDDDCWHLFKGRAFGVGSEETAEFVEIGKQIVKKCGGVPLAAKSLGGLLFFKREVQVWLQVRDSEIWELPPAEINDILPSLRLSYKYLPSNIKQCFAFCSIYPKGYKIDKQELIHLWLANGFVQSDERMELEDVGNQVFIELLRVSFFQDSEKDDCGDIKTFKMHDLIHDLACSISLNDCCALDVGKADKFPKGIRYGSLRFDSFELSNHLESPFESNLVLRTQILLGQYIKFFHDVHYLSFEKLHRLRALDLSGTETESIPSSLGRMKHLRYLNFSGTKIRLLPESLCKLMNLQSLKLCNCLELKKLPKHTGKMSSLRHLDIAGCRELTEMPIGMGQLTQLQTLSLFVVGMERGRHITELQGLNLLRGEIEIKRLEHVKTSEEAAETNLLTKQNISSLTLRWSMDWEISGGVASSAELQEKVLVEGLQPHPSLKALSIQGYNGTILPSWIGQLQNLVQVSLENCKSCERLPTFGKLPLLKFLTLKNMDSVKCMADDEFYGAEDGVGGSAAIQGHCWFPSLQKLYIYGMGALEEWSSSSSSSSSSEENHPVELTIWSCPKLKAIPFLPRVQNIRLGECNEMLLTSLANLSPHTLHTLNITSFNEMRYLPEGTFINSSTAALQTMEFFQCCKLKSLSGEIQNLVSLTSLKISRCLELESLSELEGLLKNLSSLTQLSIWDCPCLKCLPVMGIQGTNNSLTELEIKVCANLTSVSEGFRYLKSLQKLNLERCPELEFISKGGFQHLISLKSLTLWSLPKLRTLPEGMQQLTSLQFMEISHCHPDLHKRCKKDAGEDWHVISHIPELRIQAVE